MKIATYNVNGINARLPVLLRWLDEMKPDVACLQELQKARKGGFGFSADPESTITVNEIKIKVIR